MTALDAPLPLTPELRARPWGADRLRTWWPAATQPAAGSPVGEAWLAGPDTRVADGPWRGRTLADVAAAHGPAFVGTAPFARYGARMPLLVKLLDAAVPLSVQVHPDDAYAREFAGEDGDLGKTEAWWVLEADPGAHVWWGFARAVARAEVEAAIDAGTIEALLRRLDVVPGDVVVNPAGTVHALGGGVLAFEVQQASDLTFRLYDHGRVGADGLPRELHVARALDVARLTPGASVAPTPRSVAAGRTEVARTHAFVLERVAAEGGATWFVGAESLEILTHLGGGPVEVRHGGTVRTLARGASLALAAGSGRIDVAGQGVLARARYPADPAVG
ncbi:MAG: type I phosphomannose isomerase catalytic subunit [Trueperaceae bacterium]